MNNQKVTSQGGEQYSAVHHHDATATGNALRQLARLPFNHHHHQTTQSSHGISLHSLIAIQ
jgi:hypothetical protein